MFPRDTHKLIRDPLYGFVGLTRQELGIVDTEIFRRLQFIKQLSHAYVAYPSAIHTRFEHLLGTLHVSDLMARKLCLAEDQIRIVRLSCLLHDVGHGPFSHLFEHVLEKINPGIDAPHETVSRIMIEDDPELDQALNSDKGGVLELLTRDFASGKGHEKNLYADIVSSSLDADKIDYLRRDSYHIGVAYGNFDFHRIIHNIDSTIPLSDQSTGSLVTPTNICICEKGRDALESYRLARYLMHAQVYEHHARLSADQMFLRALEIAIDEESVIDRDLLTITERGDNEEFINYYKSLDDFSIYNKIISSPDARTSKEILKDIRRRKLLKRACEFTPRNLVGNAPISSRLSEMRDDEYKEISSRIAKEVGIDEHKVILHRSTINNKLYKPSEIFCKMDDGKVYDLDDDSPISGIDTEKFIVFGPADAETRKSIAAKVSGYFGIDVNVTS